MRAVQKKRELPYDWFAAGPESREAAEKVRVTSCDLEANGKAPLLFAFSHHSNFCSQIDTW